MIEMQSALKKASEKSGLRRVRYKERNIPTSIEDVVVLPFFGDMRSSFILSSLLIRRIKEESKSSKYFVLVSWPGYEGLYPHVDEYWEVKDPSVLDSLKNEVSGFLNGSSALVSIRRELNQYFYEVMSEADLLRYYSNGITKEFFERFKHVKVNLPLVPSSASVGSEFARTLSQKESKVFIHPSRYVQSWRFGAQFRMEAPRLFWSELLSHVISSGFFPVVLADEFSYDMSPEVTDGCLHIKDMDVAKVLGVMRSCGCVLDIFSGISRLALAARTPFVCFDERARFNALKEYEINDICGHGVPKEYIFGFSAIIEGGDKATWKSNVFNHLVVKLNKVYENMDRDSWPSSSESNEIVPYDSVRKIKNKKMGSRFVKIERF